MLNWDENKYDISKIVKDMVPPVGARTVYQPDQEGFLARDLTQPAGTVPNPQAIDLSSPGGTQDRLAQLENTYPGGIGALPINDTRPSAASVSPVSTDTAGVPKYQVPSDMMSYFDDVVKTLTGSSQNVDQLRNMSQGFGLIGLSPRDAAQARIGATKALGDIEGMKRNAAANLAHTLSGLMMEPSKFNRDIFRTSVEQNLGQQNVNIAGRRTAVEEAKAPWEIKKLGMAAPETVAGVGPNGERVTKTWNPQEQRWDTITSGALPVGVHEGETLINPVTKEVIGQGGEKSRFKEALGQTAFRSYSDEMKKIEDDLRFMVPDSTPDKKKQSILKAKADAEGQAWGRLQNTMQRLGYGDMFGTNATPQEGQTKQGQFGNYIYKNGKWEVYGG